jgi:hypothetical protein
MRVWNLSEVSSDPTGLYIVLSILLQILIAKEITIITRTCTEKCEIKL